jgi:hypothetical protein
MWLLPAATTFIKTMLEDFFVLRLAAVGGLETTVPWGCGRFKSIGMRPIALTLGQSYLTRPTTLR